MLDMTNKTALAFNDKDLKKLFELLKENNIDYNFVSNYVMTACPECGEYEFWDGYHCNHCGYSF